MTLIFPFVNVIDTGDGGGKDCFLVKCIEDWYERKGNCGKDGMKKNSKIHGTAFKLLDLCKGNIKSYLVTYMAQEIHKFRADARTARVFEVSCYSALIIYYLDGRCLRGFWWGREQSIGCRSLRDLSTETTFQSVWKHINVLKTSVHVSS